MISIAAQMVTLKYWTETGYKKIYKITVPGPHGFTFIHARVKHTCRAVELCISISRQTTFLPGSSVLCLTN